MPIYGQFQIVTFRYYPDFLVPDCGCGDAGVYLPIAPDTADCQIRAT